MNPAFLVEGELEKAFIENACPGAPVKRIIPNGIAVSLDVIAERIMTHFRLLKKRGHSPILIILDKEGRACTWEKLRDDLRGKLKTNGADDFIIGVCNKKIENWIIADTDGTGLSSNENPTAEETNGKKYIKSKLGEYHETTIGVQLLKKARPSIMILKSPSFADFYSSISHIKCWWLQR